MRYSVPSPPPAFTSPELPPPCQGRKFVFATPRTPGMAASERTSDWVVVMRKERSLKASAKGRLRTHSRLSSSKPDFFCIFTRSAAIMLMALVITARVMAICRTMSRTRTLLRVMARTIGPNSMVGSFSHFELHGRLHGADAPRRIEAGDQAGDEGQEDRGEDHL